MVSIRRFAILTLTLSGFLIPAFIAHNVQAAAAGGGTSSSTGATGSATTTSPTNSTTTGTQPGATVPVQNTNGGNTTPGLNSGTPNPYAPNPNNVTPGINSGTPNPYAPNPNNVTPGINSGTPNPYAPNPNNVAPGINSGTPNPYAPNPNATSATNTATTPNAMTWNTENQFWQSQLSYLHYIKQGATYSSYQPAFQFGVNEFSQFSGKPFRAVEPQLRAAWQQSNANSNLTWEQAKPAIRDAYERLYKNGSNSTNNNAATTPPSSTPLNPTSSGNGNGPSSTMQP